MGTKSLETLWAVLKQMDKRYEQRFQSQKEAISKAEAGSEKRFEGVNEFRSQLKDQAATFVTRTEMNSELAILAAKFDSIKSRADTGDGKSAGIEQNWSQLLGWIVALAAVAALFFKP